MGLSLKVLGAFALRGGSGATLSLPTRKTRALLGYLAVNANKPQPRERLMALLWSDRDEKQARQSLNDALKSIRRLGNDECLTLLDSDGEQATLRGDVMEIDVARFQSMLKDDPAGAVKLYDGPLLDGLSVPDPVFEDWLAATQSAFRTNACEALQRAADAAAASGDTKEAIDAVQRLVTLDPLREDGHRQLMQLLYGSGDRAGALRQYQACADILKTELQVGPDAATQALFDEIKEDKSTLAPIERPQAGRQGPSVDLPPLADRPSIAVLPFDNLSGDPEQEYFADGMAEDLITELSRFRWFFVIARNSSFAYKGQALDVTDLARALGVQYVVEGSVRRAGDRVRIAVQLIDGESGNHIWAERYDREIEDLFELQSDIALTIAARIEPEMAESERQRALHKSPRNLDAWNLYQRGISEFSKFTKQTNFSAERYFREAIEADPDFAAAYARLALVQQNNVFFGYAETPSEVLDAALEAARTAVLLDPRDSFAHYALGEVLIRRLDFDYAIPALETAIALNPSTTDAHYGLGLALYYSGRGIGALEHFERAAQLSPNAPNRWAYFHLQARCHLDLKEYQQAFECAGRAVRQPNAATIALAAFAASAAYLDRVDTARTAIEDLLRRDPDFSVQYVLEQFGNEFIADSMQHFATGLRKAGLPE